MNTHDAMVLLYSCRIRGSITLPFSVFQVDEWVDFSATLAVGSEFERVCAYMDSYLLLRTFLAGYHLTIADIAIFVGLFGGCHFADFVTEQLEARWPSRW